MGILMKNGVNYTGYATKNVAMAHYNSIGAIEVYFSEKTGTKVNGGPYGTTRYLTTSTSDPIAFFRRYYSLNTNYPYGYGAISLRPLVSGTDYTIYDEHSALKLTDTLVVNGITVYVYMEYDTWAETSTRVVIDDKFVITETLAKDSDISANSKFIKDIVATLSDNYILPQEAAVRYSLVEREIGTWIDGKPLYEKTLIWNGTLVLSELAWTEIPFTNVPNMDCCAAVLFTTDCIFDNRVRLKIENGVIKGATSQSGGQNIYSITLTIRYTKTTD